MKLLICLGLLAAVAAPSAHADCSPPRGLRINEVRYADGGSPTGEYLNPMVELYTKGSGLPVVSGWTLADETGAVKFTLPSLSLPAGAFLVVEFGTGDDDLDFSDGIGTIFTDGDSVEVFGHEQGAVALYAGAPGTGTIVDFVAWSSSGTPAAGSALDDAVAAGIWPSGLAVATAPDPGLSTLRLLPDGYDLDSPFDWVEYGWGASAHGSHVRGANPLQVGPVDRKGWDAGPVTFTWATSPSALSYRLVVATDSSLASGIVADLTTADTTATVVLADGLHYWRVTVIDGCGEVVAGTVWRVVALAAGTGLKTTAVSRVLGVARHLQHKDTPLLCIYDSGRNERPGCSDRANWNGPWDGPHLDDHALQRCRHCAAYCGRGAIQMLNAYFGGTLSQDEISYEFFGGAWPEHDLGHNRGTSRVDYERVLEWALLHSDVHGPFAPVWGHIKQEIDAGYPMLLRIPGHMMAIDGYKEAGSDGGGRPPVNLVHVRDPWPGSARETHDGWVEAGWRGLLEMWTINPTDSTVRGRPRVTTTTSDFDLDGIVDFDEGVPDYPDHRPRRFHSHWQNTDTDGDDVRDKQEIRSYTFYACDADSVNDPVTFSDVDGDNLRAEGDCDSDNGTQFDGGEDIHGTGVCDRLTDPFDPSDDRIEVHTSKPAYYVGERIYLAGSTFHASLAYQYDVKRECNGFNLGDGIACLDRLDTNGFGFMPFQVIDTCGVPGRYKTIVDVCRNCRVDGTPIDPSTCWSCLELVAEQSFDDPGGLDSVEVVPYRPNSPLWQVVPDAGHNGAGSYAVLDPFSSGDSVWVGLRVGLGGRPASGQTYLTYWQGLSSALAEAQVRISTDGAQSWTVVEAFGPGTDSFEDRSVDITSFLAGQDSLRFENPSGLGRASRLDSQAQRGHGAAGLGPVVIEFMMIGPPAGGFWTVDDVRLGEIPAGTVDVSTVTVPAALHLAQNFPNPARGGTLIGFDLPARGDVSLQVHDVQGRVVRVLIHGTLEAGSHGAFWDGRDAVGRPAPRGVYFYRLSSGAEVRSRKMIKLE